MEHRVKFDLRCIARSCEGNAPVTNDARCWPCRHNDHPIGERDCFFQIVGHEKNRLAIGGPKIEQQVTHDLPRLRVERPERFVHKQDFGISDQYLGQANALALAA